MPITLTTIPTVASTNTVGSYSPAVGSPLEARMTAANLGVVLSNPEKFAWALYNEPVQILGTPSASVTVYSSMVGRLDKPKNVLELVSRMPDADRKDLIGAISGANEGNIVSLLEGSTPLVAHLKSLLSPSRAAAFAPPSIGSVINPTNGLHLLLANPMVSAVVMAQRRLQTAAAAARVIPAPAGFPFGGMNPGGLNITVSQRGGAELDPAYPIEMRGGGQMIAAMKGGFGPFFLGTASSPTSWRPVDDNSFISIALEQALASLKATLAGTGTKLDSATDSTVARLIKDLKDAEEAVKKNRDALNDMNKAIASGEANFKGVSTVNMGVVQKTADAYNQSMKMRQKLENKLFRVVIALGGKVIHP
jgi:hypothetical protein